MSNKKRIILPKLSDAIKALSDLGMDLADLEYNDSEAASIRAKRAIRNFESDHFWPLRNEIYKIRESININKKQHQKKTDK